MNLKFETFDGFNHNYCKRDINMAPILKKSVTARKSLSSFSKKEKENGFSRGLLDFQSRVRRRESLRFQRIAKVSVTKMIVVKIRLCKQLSACQNRLFE